MSVGYLTRVIYFFRPQIYRRPWTDFRETATRRGMFWNWLCLICGCW